MVRSAHNVTMTSLFFYWPSILHVSVLIINIIQTGDVPLPNETMLKNLEHAAFNANLYHCSLRTHIVSGVCEFWTTEIIER